MSQSGHFRAHARHQVDFSADFELMGPQAAPRRPVRIVNLSLAGACIEAPDSVPLGASATVEVVSSILWDPLILRGRVVWSRGGRGLPTRAGLALEHTNTAQAFALFELLGSHEYQV